MKKNFDAVELVRGIREDLYEETKEMSAAELVDFFRRRGALARERIARIEQHKEVASAPTAK